MQHLIPYFSLDFLIFFVFLALNLIIGLRAGRSVKTVRDFAIGKKDFSTAAITSTIVATWFSGGFMFQGLERIYAGGLLFFAPMIGTTFNLLFTGQVLAVRMGEFLNNLSVAEAMGDLYGKTVRVITAITGIVGEVGRIAIQFQVIGKMLHLLIGINSQEATFAAAIIVILYSAFGGIRSVTVTDIFQFIAFVIFVPILALVIWYNLKEPHQVIDTLTSPIFSLEQFVKLDARFLNGITLLTFFSIPALAPSIFQRISMAKDITQAKKSFTYSAILAVLMYTSLAFVGILLLTDNTTLAPNNLVSYITNHYAYTGLKGIMVIGVVALAMSTADSSLNASTVLAVNDLGKVLFPNWKDSIKKLRIANALIGIASLGMAFYTSNILKLVLLTGNFYMPIVTAPLFITIFGFRSSSKAILLGMASGLCTVITWKMLHLDTFIEPIIPGILANLIFLVGSHYLFHQPGGWIGIQDKVSLLLAKQKRKEYWTELFQNIKNLNLREYLAKNMPSQDFIYSLLGLYALGATYSLFFTIPKTTMLHYESLYTVSAYSVLACAAVLVTYPAWPPFFRARWLITYVWPLLICYPLFVVGTQLAIISRFSGLHLMALLCNFMLVTTFLPRLLAILMPIVGILTGGFIFSLYYGSIAYSGVVNSMKFNFAYTVWVLSTFLLFIFRAKKQKEKIEIEKEHLGIAYAGKKKELAQVINYAEELAKEIDTNSYEFSENASDYIREIIYHIKDYIRLEVSSISIKKLIQDVKVILQAKFFEEKPSLLIQIKTNKTEVSVDGEKIKHLLVNAVVCIQNNNTNNKLIQIIVEDATLGYTVSYMKDYTKQIGALRIIVSTENALPPLEPIYPSHPISVDNKMKDENLVENLRIIDAHYGYIDVSRSDMHLYVIPIQVRDVRAKVMELLREPAQADPEELKHPVAIDVEQKLWKQLLHMQIDRKIVEKALDTIKRYHAGVKRKSGEPFFTHPINAALILLTYCQDQEAVIAALLHDTVEDTQLSMTNIKALFGEQVAFLVEKVTNLDNKMSRLMLEDHENVARLSNYEDKRVMYIKLADRMHNMRTISGHRSMHKQKHIAEETLNFFVPAANSLGLKEVAKELEKLSLEVLAKKEE